LVLGKHSGRNAFRARLADLGYEVTDAELVECYPLIIARADAEKEITDRDLLSIYHQVRRALAHEPAGAGPKTSTVR
jgi:2-isopropylmalate synthase